MPAEPCKRNARAGTYAGHVSAIEVSILLPESVGAVEPIKLIAKVLLRLIEDEAFNGYAVAKVNKMATTDTGWPDDRGATFKIVRRLRFMAEKTVETVQSGSAERASMLAHRLRQIDQVSQMLRSSSCFRGDIITYFEGSERGRRSSLAMRIVQWIFATKETKRRNPA
jgi:hypothetical protein